MMLLINTDAQTITVTANMTNIEHVKNVDADSIVI